ncbi:AtpZ/AtpI family protein [Desulfobaculum bizertense]|uniref:ATP synthase protein I n=1 Tax=Desulfobaculum bizertense DSM 18034 TaxID=1121442 RepID=A0A1T4WS02_9BACT|nr:AtpZ/AtpI family protein [Desulfobaculum bizertense]UIJ37281.1 AtpZ/AtpI family protein [Desulfobaculum bizertense]SKA79887.1 ATP synthase protein I [Desulfobaculum bizertense DSM 18034]
MFFGKRDPSERPLLDLMGDIGSIGMQLVVSTFVGLGMGYYLDKWLGTKPWMLIIFLILGIAAGFKNVYEQAMRMMKANEAPHEHKDNE